MGFLDDAGRFLGDRVNDVINTTQRAGQWAGASPGLPGASPLGGSPPPLGARKDFNDSSVNNRTINVGGADPIQGYDVGVWMEDKGRGHTHVLVGQFTSIVVTVKNASEAYLPAGFRQPIYFDGEIQIAFTLEKGLLDTEVFRETFGVKTFNWNNRYLRSPRFKLSFAIDPVDWMALDEPAHEFGREIRRHTAGRLVLEMCKVDTWTMGAQAGKQVVATQWTGVAQQIWNEALDLDNMSQLQPDRYAEYDPTTGEPKDIHKVPTFYFTGYADRASTRVRPVNQSRSKYPPWLTPAMLIEGEKQILIGIRNALPFDLGNSPGTKQVFDALLAAIDRIQAKMGLPGSPANKSRSVASGNTLLRLDEKSKGDSSPKFAALDAVEVARGRRNEVLRKLQATSDPAERAELKRQFDLLTDEIARASNQTKSSGPGDPNVMPLAGKDNDPNSADFGQFGDVAKNIGTLMAVEKLLSENRQILRDLEANPPAQDGIMRLAAAREAVSKLEDFAFSLRGGTRSSHKLSGQALVRKDRKTKEPALVKVIYTRTPSFKLGNDPEQMPLAPKTPNFERSTGDELIVAMASVRAKTELAIQAASAAGDTARADALKSALNEMDSIGRNILPAAPATSSGPQSQTSSAT